MKTLFAAAVLFALAAPSYADDPAAAPAKGEVKAERQEFRKEMKAQRQEHRKKMQEERKAHREKRKEMRKAHREKRKEARKAAADGAAPAPEPAK